MLRITYCEDEKKMRKQLMKIIEPELQLQDMKYQINEFDSGEALLASQLIDSVDILFLDIEMNALNGIEVATRVRQINQRVVIIFVTAFSDFVFQGYEVRALNYILKPYSKEKILDVLNRALSELKMTRHDYFIIEQKAGTIKLALSDTYYFTSNRRKITAVTSKETHTFYGKLNELILPEFFQRIHHCHFVNLNHVDRMESTALWCNQERLPISRKYQHCLRVNFAKHMLG